MVIKNYMMMNSYFSNLTRHYKVRIRLLVGIISSYLLNTLPSFVDCVEINFLDKHTIHKIFLRGGFEVSGDAHSPAFNVLLPFSSPSTYPILIMLRRKR